MVLTRVLDPHLLGSRGQSADLQGDLEPNEVISGPELVAEQGIPREMSR